MSAMWINYIEFIIIWIDCAKMSAEKYQTNVPNKRTIGYGCWIPGTSTGSGFIVSSNIKDTQRNLCASPTKLKETQRLGVLQVLW